KKEQGSCLAASSLGESPRIPALRPFQKERNKGMITKSSQTTEKTLKNNHLLSAEHSLTTNS
ncbi:TPA: hypothetical protein ACN30T_004741, partial [Vibrio parahaemolyticus]